MIISSITDPQYFSPERQDFSLVESALNDPEYLAAIQQDFALNDALPLSDAEYLESVTQLDVEPVGFTRISFIPPEAISLVVRQQNDEFIDVDFGASMKDNAALVDPASYALAPAGGIGVGVSITSVTRLSPTTIRLEVTLGTNNQPYEFAIVGDVRLATGESVLGETSFYVAEVLPPAIASVKSLAANVVEVTFTRQMENNTDLLDPTKYQFTDGLFTASVERINATTVVVTTSEQIDGVLYTLRVFP